VLKGDRVCVPKAVQSAQFLANVARREWLDRNSARRTAFL